MTDDDFRPGKIWTLPAWKKKAPLVSLDEDHRTGHAGSGVPPVPERNPARSRKGGMARAKQIKIERRKKMDANTVVFREK